MLTSSKVSSALRAAIPSYFAGTQLWCAPGVKPGGGASGGADRKEDTWVATGRMQSGFQGTPSVHDLSPPPPSPIPHSIQEL